MRNIIVCCDGIGNEISESCLRKTEKTLPLLRSGGLHAGAAGPWH